VIIKEEPGQIANGLNELIEGGQLPVIEYVPDVFG
jgi:hypothetical protein